MFSPPERPPVSHSMSFNEPPNSPSISNSTTASFINNSPQQTQQSTRRRGSSFGFNTNFFSNLTSSLRNSSSSSNLHHLSRSRASSTTSRDPHHNNASTTTTATITNNNNTTNAANTATTTTTTTNSNSNTSFNFVPSSGSQMSIGRANVSPYIPQQQSNFTESLTSLSNENDILDEIMASTPTNDGNALDANLGQGASQIEQRKDLDGTYSVRLTPFIDHSSTTPALYFSQILRKTKPNSNLPIGRYTDKVREAAQAPPGSDAPVVFKSKVVSRTHAEFLVDNHGNWFVKDLKSSSGTFLNHIRLSPAGVESEPTPLRNGDVLQLGMDFRGGVEDIFRCVKMRVETNKSWVKKANQFNKQTHERLRVLTLMNDNENELSECAICLLKIKPCQSVFLSPCSHCWHYKCIRPIVVKSYPQFLCPNCREVCDLEADLDESDDEVSEDSELESNENDEEMNNGNINKEETLSRDQAEEASHIVQTIIPQQDD